MLEGREGVSRRGVLWTIALVTWSAVSLVPWLLLKGDWIVITLLAVISLLISASNEWLLRKVASARTVQSSWFLAVAGVIFVLILQHFGGMPAWSPD